MDQGLRRRTRRFTGRDDRAGEKIDMTAYVAWQVRQVFKRSRSAAYQGSPERKLACG
jgi:hypothetical protein